MKNLLLIIGFSLITNYTFAQNQSGTTTDWGEYSTSFTSVNNEGVLLYNKVFNFFKIKKSGNTWTVKGLNGENEFLSLKYSYDNTSKQIKLASTPTLNAHFFDKSVINTQKTNGKYAANDNEICKTLAILTHDIVLKKYKTYQSLQERTSFFASGNVYVGLIENKKRHGKGILYTKNEIQKGIWKDNQKHGYFDIKGYDKTVKAYFENGQGEGTWTINFDDGGITEIVFKNDEQINTKVIKKSPEKKWNPTIKSEYEMFLFELGTPESLDDFISDRAKEIKGKGDIPLRSMQSIVKQIKYKIDARIAGVNAASKRLDNMLKTANEVGCTSTANHIKKIKKQVSSMNDNYIKAYEAFNEQQFTKSSTTFKNLVSTGFDHVTKARNDYNDLVPLVNSMNDYVCTETKVINPTPKPTQKPVKKTYSAGLFLSDNATETIITISNVSGVAAQSGIAKGDKLLYIDDEYLGTAGSSVAKSWLESTNRDKQFKIKYFDVSKNESVTILLKPATNEFKELERKVVKNYVNDVAWGDKKYTGNLYLGMPHGQGKATYPNGDVYEGDFEQGKRHHQGTMTYANGSVYKGGWYLDRKDGKSVFTTAEGIEHHGTYKRGKKSRHFYVVDKNDNIVMEYYDENGKLLFTKKKTLAEVAKDIGRTVEKPTTTNTTTKVNTTTTKETVGVGLQMKQVVGNRAFVQRTISGSAARKAKMGEGDVLLEINGKSVKGLSEDEIEKLLEGKAGTTVTVKFSESRKPNYWYIYELTRGENGTAKKLKDYKTTTTNSNTTKPSTQPTTTNSNTNNSAEQVGIGITYMKPKESEIYEITWLSSSSAAYKAGVRRFDNLLKINGVIISSKSTSEVETLLKGNKGSSVKVTIERDGKEMEFTVVR